MNRLAVRRRRHAPVCLNHQVTRHPRHDFWADDVSYRDVMLRGVIGHRQVTDAYLAQLVRNHDGRLATFDRGLAELHDDIAELVPMT